MKKKKIETQLRPHWNEMEKFFDKIIEWKELIWKN